MIGCRTRSIALMTLVVHAWINLIFAPWHHLIEHRHPAPKNSQSQVALQSERSCRCGHTHCKKPKSGSSESGSSTSNEPISHDHDDCSVCQILAQPQTELDAPIPFSTSENVYFFLQILRDQPFGLRLIDEDSRGPPAA